MKTEHKITVESGKYTFVVPADDYRVIILRHGEPWHGPQGEASNALHALMCELDAARVVVQAARETVEAVQARRARGENFDPQYFPLAIADAFALHDRLTSDREPPSAWCEEINHEPAKCPRCWFTPCRRMFQCNEPDDGLDNEIRSMEAEGYTSERWRRDLAWLRELRQRRSVERTASTAAEVDKTVMPEKRVL